MTKKKKMEEEISKYIFDSHKCLDELMNNLAQIKKIIDTIKNARAKNNKVIFIGNGGSASTASHLVCDFVKFAKIKAIALTDNIPSLTAFANDEKYEMVFANQLQILADTYDIVIGISGSGKSENVIQGIKLAKQMGCYTIGLVGFNGGKLKDVADECLIVKSDNMQHCEDMHLLIGHMIAFLLKDD